MALYTDYKRIMSIPQDNYIYESYMCLISGILIQDDPLSSQKSPSSISKANT